MQKDGDDPLLLTTALKGNAQRSANRRAEGPIKPRPATTVVVAKNK